jgi:ribonucleoside-diphosphate reductase alpha chain
MQVGERNISTISSSENPAKHLPNKEDGEETVRAGLKIDRRLTTSGENVWETTSWTSRSAVIADGSGNVFFEQKDIEVPSNWSQLATNVVASKYFRGHVGTPEREHSVRQLIGRVSNAITQWGKKDGYFATPEDAERYHDELTYLLLHQHLAFNSPVWFNVGVDTHPQCSACFINSVDDTMESILELAKTEARLFKGGSGAGSNLSPLRSSRERLSGGGTASGPVSFMRGFDSFAGVIKSGGKTRRAAKMVILNCDHPDIVEFVRSKAHEEKKAWALIDAGYDGSVNGEAYASVFFQNANHSIRVTDEFMRAAQDNREYPVKSVKSGETLDHLNARDVLLEAAKAAHLCGDPGIQFHSTINLWHTCPNTATINASNPCSEYMFLDDSACNLASLNLRKFQDKDGEFDHEKFKHAVEISILAQEIIVDNSSYPTARIAKNSHNFRPLGLGFANLGALLMSRGIAYDSEPGRDMAAAITSLMCGHACFTSARIAQSRGAFNGYARNREPFLQVMQMHREQAYHVSDTHVPKGLLEASQNAWNETLKVGEKYGFRNGQVTVIAPTGTIAFMMDCDTTGIEPDIALIKYKRLVGGGMLKIVNNTVPLALKHLDYSDKEAQEIVQFIDENETIEGAPGLKDQHLPIFDCAFRPANGTRSISPLGHVKMMSAVQPFLSGAISKTVNMPEDASVDDIYEMYVEGWKRGLKALAVYRDNCKRAQPLSTKKDDEASSTPAEDPKAVGLPARRQLPPERPALTHKFAIGGHEGYITVGMFADGLPGEIFITMSKEGSTIRGLMDTIATSISLALQYGVPLQALVDRFSHMRFEPSGFTGNPDIPIAKSIVDYIFRWLAIKFIRDEEDAVDTTLSTKAEAVLKEVIDAPQPQMKLPIGVSTGNPLNDAAYEKAIFRSQADSPPCHVCGTLTVRSGACYTCPNCGTSSGCS